MESQGEERLVLKVQIGNEDRVKTIKFQRNDTVSQAIKTIDKANKRDGMAEIEDYWGIYLPKQQRWAPEDMTLIELGLAPFDTIVYRSTTRERTQDTLAVMLHKLAESMGTVIVKVKAGKNLAPKDSNGLSDPFVVVRLLDGASTTVSTDPNSSGNIMGSFGIDGGRQNTTTTTAATTAATSTATATATTTLNKKQKFKTKIIKETLNPVWGDDAENTFQFEVSSVLNQKLSFECWDWDFGKKNDFMGQFFLNVRQLATRGPVLGKADPQAAWYPLIDRERRRRNSNSSNNSSSSSTSSSSSSSSSSFGDTHKKVKKQQQISSVSGALLIEAQLVITKVGGGYAASTSTTSPRRLSMPSTPIPLPKPTMDYRSQDKSIEHDYTLGKVLRQTNTGEVREATSKLEQDKLGQPKKCTVKVLNKNEIIYELREAEILKSFRHPHVVNLLGLYEDNENVYFVMEYVDGGELFDRIVDAGSFSELDSKEVVKQVLLALVELHKLGIAHRDLKPEKLLLQNYDTDGCYIKISGFGRAKVRSQAGMMRTLCGTPQYLAPEMLSGEGYGVEVDMWGVGIITYILLSGYPPFYSDTDDLAEIFQQIMKAEYKCDPKIWSRISLEAKEFVEALLVLDPKRRMTAKQALEHPWLTGAIPVLTRKGSFTSGIKKGLIRSVRL
eukprot:TRINITY_DN1759_c1_g1_i2.p1 TRINITY_DN1759_c1_g1~~TRINITY_DN1759_c1_g1_i2.p1  ORF type:complete len:670 (+),score=173.94 TRINITY_DN1759_c1_g1_i2:118-2127(+)